MDLEAKTGSYGWMRVRWLNLRLGFGLLTEEHTAKGTVDILFIHTGGFGRCRS
jgi:hypothetical protein